MLSAYLLQLGVWMGLGWGVRSEPPFNNPPSVDIWCGKAYRDTNSSFDPGGQITQPARNGPPSQLYLDLRVYARKSYYLEGEERVSFVVDTPVTSWKGDPFKNGTFEPDKPGNASQPFTELKVFIGNNAKNQTLANWVRVPVNASGTEIEVSLEGVEFGTNGNAAFSVIGNSPDGIQTYYRQVDIQVRPQKNDTGSMARIDRLYGGLEVRSGLTNDAWKPIFPYSFYTSWDWIASTINNASAPKDLSTFRDLGYNIIHPVPPGGSDPYDPAVFSEFLRICDELELYVMYDMRHTYQNKTSITSQLSLLQSHPSLLLYYTADEPDGWCDPLNATSLAYKHIQSIDPYHPVSLVLNCANFYFKEYTSGADIVLEDTYPIIKSSVFSTVYNTVCNATYGDCGCDNCHVNDPAYPAYVHNEWLDVSERVDDMYTYQDWIDRPSQAYRKPFWGVPQGFFDADSFWSRWPTAAEEAVMALLRVNHGVKGIVVWIYPTSDEVEGVTSELAQVVAREDVTGLLLGSPLTRLQVEGSDLVDAAAWVGSEEMLVIVVNQARDATGGAKFQLPKKVTSLEVLYGWDGWGLTDDQVGLENSQDLAGLEVSILKAQVKE